MQTFRIIIEPVSPGTQQGSRASLQPGDGSYALTPQGPLETQFSPTTAQLAGVLGYIELINAGATTTSIESAVTAVGPT